MLGEVIVEVPALIVANDCTLNVGFIEPDVRVTVDPLSVRVPDTSIRSAVIAKLLALVVKVPPDTLSPDELVTVKALPKVTVPPEASIDKAPRIVLPPVVNVPVAVSVNAPKYVNV